MPSTLGALILRIGENAIWMGKLRILVNDIAYGKEHIKFSHGALLPFLFAASFVYKVAHSARLWCYRHSVLRSNRLPVPVISVGNLTWGGNGKTPMTEFIASFLLKRGLSPLILTRGYAGGDEAKMLTRHFHGQQVKIGVGANRFATATHFLSKHGYRQREEVRDEQDPHSKFDAVILDDGMQHLSLQRDIEIVMVNARSPFGNGKLLPLGPLREPFSALKRADAVILHHANLATENQLDYLHTKLREVNNRLPVFSTGMFASHFFDIKDAHSLIPLNFSRHRVVMCVSGIGYADAFVLGMKKVGARYVDHVDFSDHHEFDVPDMDLIRRRLKKLEGEFGEKATVVITEKDHDRDPDVFRVLDPYKVVVLCSKLKFLLKNGKPLKDFESLLMKNWS